MAVRRPRCLYAIEITLFRLKIENLDPRGIQLSALFMSGVDMALFANDACGQPVPWEHCCPWVYFDGRLFQSKLLKASRERAPLLDLCDGQVSRGGSPGAVLQIWDDLNGQAPHVHLPMLSLSVTTVLSLNDSSYSIFSDLYPDKSCSRTHIHTRCYTGFCKQDKN